MTGRARQRESATIGRQARRPDHPSSDKHERLKNELDNLLDNIDGVLEANAEAFVRHQVQAGGQ